MLITAAQLEDQPMVINYDVNGNPSTIVVTHGGHTYTQTYTWDGTTSLTISEWVRT